jgi:hypothetical protein
LNAVGAAHDPEMYGATFAERPSDEQPPKERLEVPNS